ncbi:hypothetical protein TNCV_4485311 [Trichonephila clavipes]|nr:hypothetical protein TNCV_4485311 [Trichonephila clavipes]
MGLEKNHLLGIASAWPNTKFRYLLSTTGPFEASDSSEMARIVQQNRSSPGGAITFQLLRRSLNRHVANVVAKKDAKKALSPPFRYASIKLPL